MNPKTQIICVESGIMKSADILSKTSRSLRVVLTDGDLTLRLSKSDPHDRVYVGRCAGLEFASSGELK